MLKGGRYAAFSAGATRVDTPLWHASVPSADADLKGEGRNGARSVPKSPWPYLPDVAPASPWRLTPPLIPSATAVPLRRCAAAPPRGLSRRTHDRSRRLIAPHLYASGGGWLAPAKIHGTPAAPQPPPRHLPPPSPGTVTFYFPPSASHRDLRATGEDQLERAGRPASHPYRAITEERAIFGALLDFRELLLLLLPS